MTRKTFNEQLEQLNVELIRMGALCEEAISAAPQALLDGDMELGQQANRLEQEIDHKERDIESQCMKLLLHQQPVASDLRAVSAALRMISDMERIGDQAADIAEIARACRIEPATLTSLLNRMEEQGMLQRHSRPDNRRSFFIFLTPLGTQLAQRVTQTFEPVSYKHLTLPTTELV